MTTDSRTEEIRARWAGVDWRATTQGGLERADYSGPGEVSDSLAQFKSEREWIAAAHAPDDLAYLLDRIETLEGDLASARRSVEDYDEEAEDARAERDRLRGVADAARAYVSLWDAPMPDTYPDKKVIYDDMDAATRNLAAALAALDGGEEAC